MKGESYLKFKTKAKVEKKHKPESESTALDPELAKYKKAKKIERRNLVFMLTMIIVFIIFLSSVIYFSGPRKTSQLSAYNDRWNDISYFREHLNDQTDSQNRHLYETSSVISSPTVLRDIAPEETEDYLYIALGIEKKYSTDEVEAILDFIWDGGSAIVADDYGYGNTFIETAQEIDESINVRFANKPLWDENYAKDPRFIKINVNRDESKLDFEGIILLNDPTAIVRDTTEKISGRTLVSSSNKGWIDIDGNGIPSPNIRDERMGKKPIVHEEDIGSGTLVLISDPSIFINNMWVRENNSAFANALVRYLIPSIDENNIKINVTKHVIFDESLHIQENVFSNARHSLYQGMVVFTTDTQLAILIGILTLLFLGVLIIIIEDPPELRHKYNINFYNLNELLNTNITVKDCDRIRYIYLERLRMAQSLSIAEFKELSYDELYEMIQDEELVEFALDWDKKYYGEDLERLLLKIRDSFE